MNATPHRLLVPIDALPGSAAAVDVAVRLARAVHGTVTLLGVAPLAMEPGGDPAAAGIGSLESDAQQELDRLAQAQIAAVAARIGDGVDVRTALTWEPAGSAIVEEADEGGHDLVVIGWRAGPVGHLLHDRAARHVLDHSPVPVVVVRSSPAAADRTR
jgi:nucleotide-binding universal stress UspA family protein